METHSYFGVCSGCTIRMTSYITSFLDKRFKSERRAGVALLPMILCRLLLVMNDRFLDYWEWERDTAANGKSPPSPQMCCAGQETRILMLGPKVLAGAYGCFEIRKAEKTWSNYLQGR